MFSVLHVLLLKDNAIVIVLQPVYFTKKMHRHRILTAFTKHITGFTITDAADLEAEKDPIQNKLMCIN